MRAPAPAALTVVDAELAARIAAEGGPRAVARAIRRLKRAVHPGLVAAPAAPTGAFDGWGADVVLCHLPADPAVAATSVLAAGIRAAGRPLLVDVRSPDTPPEAFVAARDVGAAGALVRTGDEQADARLAAAALAQDAARLHDAPLISVVVCNYNGARYLDGCLTSLRGLPYPRYEVILCDDGSTDDSVAVARRFGEVRVLELEHAGLSVARNAGWRAAQGELVAYLDGDAAALPGWLPALWRICDRLGADGAGGPNLPFPDAGWEERAVSGAPGAAIPVVDADGGALHLAGCNMAFRRSLFDRVGGFDPTFVASTDDVEFCLRALDEGARLRFSPTAAVVHHRRDTMAGFIRQQRAYGASSVMEQAPQRELIAVPERTLLQRLDPRRPRYVLTGPQARQLYTVTSQPLHIGMPSKLLVAGLAAGLVGALPAARLGRLGLWGGATLGGASALVAVVSTRAPVFAPEPGPRGLRARLATAALWFAMPVARSWGRLRGRRG